MAKAEPTIHIQLEDAGGSQIGVDEEIKLSDKQLDWLAEFFAPIVKESFTKRGGNHGHGMQRAGTD